ncbi:uncharacterized protein LOC143363163 [Halictus rubicundus]|uniref:uncharacterized protein LOC143363163 n=1 Tax=Halictus rubicundus TaxID=77578 RepID=UPI0040353277
MREYEVLGHMRQTPVAPIHSSEQSYYIPHHAVFRESSSTTSLRVVFNASCRTTNGQSLNDHLLPGPKLQGDLIAILLRWRQSRFVYAADIAKMYRQIKVNEHDLNYQRILWRISPTEPIKEYQLRTVTYGTSSAPFQALRVIQQLAVDEGQRFPLAVPVLQDQTYVDDCLFGADSPELLRRTRDQLIALLQAGGFRLRKWASNTSSLLEDIDPTDHGLASTKSITTTDTIPILGIAWIPALDRFQIRLHHSTEPTNTKRAVLSALARLFDPLGWIAPVVVTAKLIMQRLWAARCDWDEPIPDRLRNEWQTYLGNLPDLEAIQIPRPIASGPVRRRSLHGFADASSTAYAAAVYIRSVLQDGRVEIELLIAKSRVAPVKTISVPRLELSAALLLASLVAFVRSSLRYEQCETHCWTDSSIVLTWLSQSPAKWKTFVANRVAKIQASLPDVLWHHVPTQDNPADCASRAWSQFPTRSSWPKLIRVTAYVQRFIKRLRSQPRGCTTTALLPDEVAEAKRHWLKRIQADTSPQELRTLAAHGTVPKSSPLSSLNPYLDSDGLIRAKGRLSKAQPETENEPIILRSHPLLSLLIHHTHLTHLHAGPQLTLACLRHEYWILRARATVRAVLYRCVPCTRERAAIPHQLMGDLPASRITKAERAFIHTGVDYAGPIQVRTARGRGHKSQKAYIAVFICLTTKAVHLEVVSDYTSAAFLAAYHRFVSRRGLPRSMSSDNGTTFHGANRELTTAYRAATRDTNVHNKLAIDGVTWHFLPPTAPHFGGLWEAAVKSVKHHLKRCIGAHTLTFEELWTFLCRAEACLNSRPIAPTSECLDDYSVLTPGHFLIGAALVASPEPSALHLAENRLSRWQLIQRLTETCWRAWMTDYVQTLLQHPKWKTRQNLTKVGQIVLLRNTNTPPYTWALRRIVACHPGDDGLVRVVTVKTAHAEFKRPIAKLCFLPVAINEASDASIST